MIRRTGFSKNIRYTSHINAFGFGNSCLYPLLHSTRKKTAVTFIRYPLMHDAILAYFKRPPRSALAAARRGVRAFKTAEKKCFSLSPAITLLFRSVSLLICRPRLKFMNVYGAAPACGYRHRMRIQRKPSHRPLRSTLFQARP